jgi:hypothetical protein
MAGGVTKTPDFIFRPAIRLKQALAAGTSITNATSAYEIVVIAGSARGIVRAKFSQAATLFLYFVGPDTQFATGTGTTGAATVNTQYASNQPGSVALAANTENFLTFTHNGEGYLQVLITAGGTTGTVSFVDVACI